MDTVRKNVNLQFEEENNEDNSYVFEMRIDFGEKKDEAEAIRIAYGEINRELGRLEELYKELTGKDEVDYSDCWAKNHWLLSYLRKNRLTLLMKMKEK